MRLNKLLMVFASALMLLGGVQNADASVKLKALSGSVGGDRENNGGKASEGPAKLVDEQTNSKFGTWDGYYGHPVYVIMKASDAIAPKSYELISANDTNGDTGRSWSQWKIYGGNFASDADATIDAEGWVLIDSKVDQSLNKEQYAVNKLNISKSISDGTYYTYFKIVVEAIEGGFSNKYCQMDGFRFTNVKFKPSDVTFTCTAGKKFGEGEGIDKMFDLDCNTKYCQNAGSDCYALVTASEPVFVWGYDLTTANDNNGGRKVTKWSLYGTNDETVAADPDAEGWVTLSNIDKNSYIEGKNWYTQRFFCNKGAATTAYKYFKVTLDDGDFIQLSEFRFCYDTYRVMTYNWKEGPDNSKKAFDGLPNPKWEGGNSDFVGKSFTIESADGKSYAVKKYHFTTNDDGSWKDRAPKSWTIEGSDDNNNWVKVAEVNDYEAIHNTNFTTYEFTPDNTTDAFRYYKLTLNAMKGTGWSQVGDFQVLAISDVSDKDYYTDLVNNAKSSAYDRGSISETDVWYVEYKNLYDGLDALLAAGISSGNYAPVVSSIDKMDKLVELMDKFKASQNNYVAFDGTSTWGDGHWSQLFDGKDGREDRESTKWGGNFSGKVGDAGHVQYVIFRTKEAMQPYFYRLVTGGDTKTQKTRNWRSWKVYGANFTTLSDAVYDPSKWTVLDSRENIDEKYLPMENCYPAAFDFKNGVTQPYLYYMVAVTESYGSEKDGEHVDGTQQQMNEMYLCTQEEFESMRTPLVAYFDDFDKTRPIEADKQDKLTLFNEKFSELKTTADAVQLTLIYNECVALRTELEESMGYMDLVNNVTAVDGVYQLESATDVVLFEKVINAGRNALNATLTADIELTAEKMPAPIGNQDYPYKGIFDGQGKSIKNFTFNDANANNVGFFGITNGATIKNVVLTNANVVGKANAGGLVGNAQNATTINKCAVLSSYVEGNDHVAAIAANAVGGTVISNNYSNATIKSRNYQAGGMVGTIMSATIENNLFTGTVTCEEGGDASGLVSRIDGDADPVPVIRNNMVAASAVTGGATYSLLNTCGRQGSYEKNYILDATTYSTGAKTVTDENDQNGKQITWIQATSYSQYKKSFMWDLTNDWKFICGGMYPILKIMPDVSLPTQDVEITPIGYATMVAKYDFDLADAGFEAYAVTVSEIEGNVHLTAVNKAQHGEALLLKKENGGNFELQATATATSKASANLLVAAEKDVKADGTQYILANGAEGVGFYQATKESTIAAGKGYLVIEAAAGDAGVKSFYGFEVEDATAIANVNVNDNDNQAVIYNVAGQRVSKMQKGINIVNGKKVLK